MIEFSIVIPTRDGAATIGRTIASALAQTYPHFEIIVLESGSADDTRAIVASFDDDRLKLLADDRALDICANWRRILELDLKPYLTILGSDDLLYPNFLSEIARLIEAQPGASLYHTHFNLIDSDDRVIRRCKPFPSWESGESFLRERQHYRRDLFATGYVMRAADYRRLGGFPPFAGLYYADDFCFYRLGAIGGVACSPETAFGYRYHTDSAAYRVDLLTLYDASRAYLLALGETEYGRRPENRALARAFVAKTFARRRHRLVYDLLVMENAAEVAAYRRDSRLLFERAAVDRLFAVSDPAGALLDRLLDLPPGAVKRLTAGVIRAFAVATRGMRK